MNRILDEIAARAADHLRRERLGEAVAGAVHKGVWLLPAGAAFVLLLRATGTPIGAIVVLGLAVLPFGLWVGLEAAGALFGRVCRDDALGRVDHELDLHDRLRTADEFLAVPDRTSFMEAAVNDAASHLEAARTVALPDRGARPETRAALAATSAFLLVVAALLATPERLARIRKPAAQTAGLDEQTARRSESRPVRNPVVPPRTDSQRPGAPPTGAAEQKEAAGQAGDRDRTKKATAATGRTARTGGSGSKARSADASGAPSAAGRASTQKLKPKARTTRAARKRKRNSKPIPPRAPPQRDSGATSGSARSSGSSRNPTASQWKTRDTPPDDFDEPVPDDEEIDDESEENESRGGMQPNLRSRKPPANRDLGLGFGNRASRRANGRGGASPRKKSRGTASLVLGVPVPDHIKGQPNPGTTKVTRERGDPEREKADAAEAGPRTKRSAPAGAVPRAELPPWLREMVRRYFLEETENDS